MLGLDFSSELKPLFKINKIFLFSQLHKVEQCQGDSGDKYVSSLNLK